MTESLFQRFSDRFFQVSPLYTKPGWYIKLREGSVDGPYPSKKDAQAMLFNLYGIPPEMSDGQIFNTQESEAPPFVSDCRSST